MKKMVFALAIVAALVVALFSTGQVSAQGPNPTNPQGTGPGYSNGGGMGGRGMRGAGMGTPMAGSGILHDAMIEVYAQELGLSVDELNTRLESGEKLSQIAFEKGLTAEQFTTLMAEARSQAIAQAVEDGTLTQAQADWMNTRAANRQGMRGGNGGNSGCPYYPQTTP